MKTLRAPGGCPWDRAQTHASLRPFLLEETHEVLEAIRSRCPQALQDELGDLLFQVIFHAQIASESGRFTIEDVIEGSLSKMRRRHPHIFGSKRLRTASQVLENWEQIKARERKNSNHSLLTGVPKTLPALIRAHRVQTKAARVGFTWSKIDEALAKLQEEIAELEGALRLRSRNKIMEEIGDALFALVNLARFAGANPEDALHQAVGKFIRQFSQLEKQLKKEKLPLNALTPEALLARWAQTKRLLRSPNPIRARVKKTTRQRTQRGKTAVQ
jgi:tetrapyrrole methylase family protein/MazG family protein